MIRASHVVCCFRGVENGSVKTEFYDSVCSFGSKSERIRNALSVGLFENLHEFDATQENATFIENELSDAELARKFFSRLSDKRALEWFRKIISAGLNPNLVVTDKKNSYSLLHYALIEGNIEAAIVLLESGSTPHVYEQVWGVEYYDLDFLFPLELISRLPGTREEKRRLIRAMFDAGLFVLLDDSLDKGLIDRERENIQNNNKIINALNINIQTPQENNAVCKNASKFSRYDWCAEADKVPSWIIHEKQGSFYDEFDVFYFASLIGVYKDKMYFITLGLSGYASGNVGLARVKRGADHIVLYRYTPPAAGMGHCSRLRARDQGLEPGGYIDADRDARCWRRIVIQRSIVDDFYIGPYDIKYNARDDGKIN